MSLEAFLRLEKIIEGSSWQVDGVINGYEAFEGNSLSTQAGIGRRFKVINCPELKGELQIESSRIMVSLLEDGYKCWFEISELLQKASLKSDWVPNLLSESEIEERIPSVLQWLQAKSTIPNKYLWGGTVGPDYDCSGLVQAAFSSQGIWLPRDAYQQEQFCEKVNFLKEDFKLLLPGDLIFFGTAESCNHVAIHIDKGNYWHSSGILHGSNGIGMNSLGGTDSISAYYQAIFRSIGRVSRCHDGTTLP